MKYLYIPFSKQENNESLLELAEAWRKTTHKEKPSIFSCENKIDFENPCTIYILGHGIRGQKNSSKKYISNVKDDKSGKKNLLSIEEIAYRIKACGLNPDISCTIKLFFCDESHVAEDIAEKFCQALGEEFWSSDIHINYYQGVILSAPKPLKDGDTPSKRAFKDNGSGLLYGVGKAKDHKETIHLQYATHLKREKKPEDLQWLLSVPIYFADCMLKELYKNFLPLSNKPVNTENVSEKSFDELSCSADSYKSSIKFFAKFTAVNSMRKAQKNTEDEREKYTLLPESSTIKFEKRSILVPPENKGGYIEYGQAFFNEKGEKTNSHYLLSSPACHIKSGCA